MKKIIILILAGVMCFSGYSYAGIPEVGRYTSVEGRADVLRAGEDEPVRLKADDPVYEGDIVRTKSSARAEIVFGDNSVLRLAPGSRVAVEEYKIDSDGSRQSAQVRLYRGKARAIVSKAGKAENFQILTPTAKGVVKGTDIVAFYQADNTGVYVTDGSMSVENLDVPGEVKELRKGQCLNVAPGEHFGKCRKYHDAEIKMHHTDTTPVFKGVTKASGKDMIKMKGMVTSTSGEVTVIRAGRYKSIPAVVGQVMAEGDLIATGENGQAELTLENGNKIAMQSSSELKINTMRHDPKTGEYDNSFESKKGKLKAIVERIGSKSTFSVKTPLASCGVRGTVMYLNIEPGQTTAFYEGGDGYMTSEITGVTEDVGAGQNSTADVNGNISVPMDTSSEERVGLDDSWEAGESVEDYAAPEDTGIQDQEGEEGSEGSSDTAAVIEAVAEMVEDAVGEAEVDELLSEIPFDEYVDEETELPEDVSYTDALSVTGEFGRVSGGLQPAVGSSVDGIMAFSAGSVTWGGNFAADMAGTYDDAGSGYTLWVDDIDPTDATDGGRYAGEIGGTMVNGKFKSTALMLYIDPSGFGGVMHMNTSGGYADGVFASTGQVKVDQREYLGAMPSDLDSLYVDDGDFTNGLGIGNFDVGGTLTLIEVSGDTKVLGAGRGWGAWFMDMRGSFAGSTSNNWTLAIGANHANGGDTSSFIGSVNGTEWVNAGLDASYDGFFFDDNGAGGVNGGHIHNGRFVGTYDSVGFTWEAVGCGEWVEVTDLLTEAGLGFTINDFDQFITVPITESHYANVSGAAGGITEAHFDMRFYENVLNNIWAGSIQGQHDGTMTDSWSLNLAGDGNNVTLTGDKWSDGTWHADVLGTTSEGNNFTGEAAGTYCDTKQEFNGIGGGTWTSGE